MRQAADGGLCRRLSGAERRRGVRVRLAGCGYGQVFAGFGVGGLDGDLVAEAFQGAGVAAGAAADICLALVVAGPEVLVSGVGVGQEGVGDDELAPHDGGLGLLLRHAGAQAPVLGAQEGLGPADADGCLAECPANVGVAAAGGVLALALARGFRHPGSLPGPGRQVAGGREDAHVGADLGDEVLGGGDPEPGDSVELLDLPLVRPAHLRDLLIQDLDLGSELVDAVQHHLQYEGVLLGEERAVQGLFQLGGLAAHHAPRHAGQHLRVALAGRDRAEHVPAGHPVDVADHRGQLQVRFSEQSMWT